jgi:hypothetical protein
MLYKETNDLTFTPAPYEIISPGPEHKPKLERTWAMPHHGSHWYDTIVTTESRDESYGDEYFNF